MADDATTAPDSAQDSPDTPDQGAPEAQHSDDGNWEQRFKDTQSKLTQTSQELAGAREQAALVAALQNPETQAEALKALGLEVEYLDEQAQQQEEALRDPRVDELIAHQQEREALEVVNQMVDHIDTLAKEASVTLTAKQRNAILNEAIDAGANPDSTVDVFKAWTEDLNTYRDEVIKGYRASKSAPAPPPKAGGSGTSPVPVRSAKDRLALANQIAEESMRSHD